MKVSIVITVLVACAFAFQLRNVEEIKKYTEKGLARRGIIAPRINGCLQVTCNSSGGACGFNNADVRASCAIGYICFNTHWDGQDQHTNNVSDGTCVKEHSLKNGDSCGSSYWSDNDVCGTSSYCNNAHICSSKGTEGAACDSHGCVQGLFCDSAAQICKKYLAKGAACNEHDYNPCGIREETGLWCDEVDHVCVDGSVGTSCRNIDECLGATRCNYTGSWPNPGRCLEAAYANAGEACNEHYGPKCNPSSNLWCNGGDTGKCILLRSKKDGESCTDSLECQEPSFCNGGVCIAFLFTRGAGEDCGHDTLSTLWCKEGLVCSRITQRCSTDTVAKNLSQPCTSDANCGDAGTCQCDHNTGIKSCFQLPVSSSSLWKNAKSVLDCAATIDAAEELEKCLNKWSTLQQKFAPYDFTCDPASIALPAFLVTLILAMF